MGDDTSNFMCPDCGYEAPGPKVLKFHIDKVRCTPEKIEPIEMELRRLIAEQERDARTYRYKSDRWDRNNGEAKFLASLDIPRYIDHRGRYATLHDLLADNLE